MQKPRKFGGFLHRTASSTSTKPAPEPVFQPHYDTSVYEPQKHKLPMHSEPEDMFQPDPIYSRLESFPMNGAALINGGGPHTNGAGSSGPFAFPPSSSLPFHPSDPSHPSNNPLTHLPGSFPTHHTSYPSAAVPSGLSYVPGDAFPVLTSAAQGIAPSSASASFTSSSLSSSASSTSSVYPRSLSHLGSSGTSLSTLGVGAYHGSFAVPPPQASSLQARPFSRTLAHPIDSRPSCSLLRPLVPPNGSNGSNGGLASGVGSELAAEPAPRGVRLPDLQTDDVELRKLQTKLKSESSDSERPSADPKKKPNGESEAGKEEGKEPKQPHTNGFREILSESIFPSHPRMRVDELEMPFAALPPKHAIGQNNKPAHDTEKKQGHTKPLHVLLFDTQHFSFTRTVYLFQTLTDHGAIWGQLSSLYRTIDKMSLQSPPSLHLPLYSSAFTYLKLEVDLQFFPVPPARSNSTSASNKHPSESSTPLPSLFSLPSLPSLPFGSRHFTVMCFPEYSRGIEAKEYRCKIVDARAIHPFSDMGTVVDDHVMFEVELFQNEGDVLHLGKTSDIYYLDFRVGYNPDASTLPDRDYRLYWRAIITEDASQI